jgi:hypothetical protein
VEKQRKQSVTHRKKQEANKQGDNQALQLLVCH